jgi:hypothetical protein
MEVFLFMPQPVVEGRPGLRWLLVVDEVALFRAQQVMQAVLAGALPVHPQVEFLAALGLLGKGIMAVQEMLAKLLVVEEVLALLVEMLQQALEVLVALGLHLLLQVLL